MPIRNIRTILNELTKWKVQQYNKDTDTEYLKMKKKIDHCYRRSQWWNKKYALLILWKNASNENKIKWYFTRTTIFELINNVEKLEI